MTGMNILCKRLTETQAYMVDSSKITVLLTLSEESLISIITGSSFKGRTDHKPHLESILKMLYQVLVYQSLVCFFVSTGIEDQN